MAIPGKGLQDMRTLSGTVDQACVPYKAFMKLSCLEMERFRRGKELESAMHRVNNINARFEEIEREKAAILRGLGAPSGPRRTEGPSGPEKSARRSGKSGFKIRY